MDAGHFRETLIICSVVGYIGLTSILAFVLRSRTSAQFMVGSRALPAVVIGVLLMSEFIGAKSTVGTAQEAFENGMAAGWSVHAAAIGFLLLAFFFARRIYSSKEHTISGLVEQRFGNGARIVVSLIMIYALLLVNVGNYVSGAAALSSAIHTNLPVSTFIIAAFSAIYYVFGGIKSIAWVTVLHSVVKLGGIAILVAVAASLSGGLAPIQAHLPPAYFTWDGEVGPTKIFAWIIGTVGAIFSTQYIVQAIASTKSASAARGSVLIAAALCLPLGFALGFIGVAARYLYPTQDSLYALPVFITKMPAPLAAVVTVSLVASVLVSVSTVAVATTALVMRDFYVPWRKPEAEHELRATRYVALAVGMVPLLCVFFTPHILELSFFTRALRLSIAIVALVGVYLPWLGSPRSAITSLVLSGVATSAWYLLGNPFGIDNMYVAALTPAVVLLAERLISGPRPAPAAPPHDPYGNA
jgi:SSS family solute:Na+ symporter